VSPFLRGCRTRPETMTPDAVYPSTLPPLIPAPAVAMPATLPSAVQLIYAPDGNACLTHWLQASHFLGSPSTLLMLVCLRVYALELPPRPDDLLTPPFPPFLWRVGLLCEKPAGVTRPATLTPQKLFIPHRSCARSKRTSSLPDSV